MVEPPVLIEIASTDEQSSVDLDALADLEKNVFEDIKPPEPSAEGTTPEDPSPPPVPDKTEELAGNPEVAKLLQNTKNTDEVDFKLLDNAAQAVKTFLIENEDQVGALLDTKEFLPFLMQCLRAKPHQQSLQHTTAWIYNAILTDANSVNLRKLGSCGSVHYLIKFLNSFDLAVREEVTLSIRMMALNRDIREELMSNLLSSSYVLNTLGKFLMAEKPAPSDQLIQNVFDIVVAVITQGNKFCQASINKDLPPCCIVEDTLPVLGLMMAMGAVDNEEDEKIHKELLQCLCSSIVAAEDLYVFVGAGLGSVLTSYLEDPDEEILTCTAIALGGCARKGPKEFQPFLEGLEGTEGLKHYWKCFKLNIKDNEQLDRAILTFVNGICSIIANDTDDLSGTMAVITSNYVYALVFCLKKDVPETFKKMAITTLGNICSVVPNGKREAIAKMGVLPLAVQNLKSPEAHAISGAAKVVGSLALVSPKRRDDAVGLGALKILLEIVQKPLDVPENLIVVADAMRAINNICILNKKLPMQVKVIKDVPAAMAKFFTQKVIPKEISLLAIQNLAQFLEYEQEGIDLLLECDQIPDRLISFLSSDIFELQQKSIEIIRLVCEQGSYVQRQRFLSMGILDKFEVVLTSELLETRKAGLECLFLLLDETLSTDQKVTVEQFRVILKNEMTKRIPETLTSARSVYDKMIH